MIPVCEPIFNEDEIQAVVSAMRRGEISGSFGTTITKFEEKFANYSGCKYGVAVTSGTTALHLAVAISEIGANHEILISASTNIATALAVIHNGAIPIPIDSENITWNLDLDLLEAHITPNTRAIIPVHLYGHPVDMDRLLEIAKKYNLIVIEDCAESHGATCRGKKTGSFGDMGCFSFYANKIITTGEGGMVITNNYETAERLRLFRNLGFTKPRFRHEIAGYNFRLTGYQAAMGLAQLQKIERIISEKRRLAKIYNHHLSKIPGIQLPVEADWARHVYWMYAIVIQPEFGMSRDLLMEWLRKDGIDSRTFFCPMNQQPCLRSLPGYKDGSYPVADKLWENGLYLPSTYTLPEKTVEYIADSIRGAYRNAH
jgi:perosamine synthetase